MAIDSDTRLDLDSFQFGLVRGELDGHLERLPDELTGELTRKAIAPSRFVFTIAPASGGSDWVIESTPWRLHNEDLRYYDANSQAQNSSQEGWLR